MCTLIRADTVTGTNPASEFLMGSQLSGAEPLKAKLPVLVSEPGWGCLAPVWRRQTLLSITSAQSHLTPVFMGGFSQDPLLPGTVQTQFQKQSHPPKAAARYTKPPCACTCIQR